MKNSHLSLADRIKIQEGIENELTKAQIAKNIKKDPTTVSKEIKNRRKLKPRNPFNNPITCTKFKQCGICKGECSEYEEIKFLRKDRYFYNSPTVEKYLKACLVLYDISIMKSHDLIELNSLCEQ